MNMKNELAQFVTTAAQNPKTVATVSLATAGSGVSTAFDWISRGIGVTASLVGIMLTIMLIRKSMMEQAKIKLEIQALREREDRRHREACDRKDHHEPLRRADDEC